jgi:hypothetical protein
VGAGGLVVLFAVAGLVVWDRDHRTAGPRNPGTFCAPVVSGGHRNPLVAPGVHRVALIGDSIMFQPSCAIAESLAGAGITTSRHGISGSGLLNGSTDWVSEADRIVKAEKPDVVVAIFVGNYADPPVRDASGAPIARNSPAYFAAWQQRAQTLSDVVTKGGAELYWVSPPPIALSDFNAASRLFDGYRTISGDHTLDSGRVLAGPDGKEIGKKVTCGADREIRAFDGVHLTDDGARIYGQQIAHDLTAAKGVLTTPKPC